MTEECVKSMICEDLNVAIFCCFSGGLVSFHLCGRGGLTPLQRLFKADHSQLLVCCSAALCVPRDSPLLKKNPKNKTRNWRGNKTSLIPLSRTAEIPCSQSVPPYLASQWPWLPLRNRQEVLRPCHHLSPCLLFHSPCITFPGVRLRRHWAAWGYSRIKITKEPSTWGLFFSRTAVETSAYFSNFQTLNWCAWYLNVTAANRLEQFERCDPCRQNRALFACMHAVTVAVLMLETTPTTAASTGGLKVLTSILLKYPHYCSLSEFLL